MEIEIYQSINIVIVALTPLVKNKNSFKHEDFSIVQLRLRRTRNMPNVTKLFDTNQQMYFLEPNR